MGGRGHGADGHTHIHEKMGASLNKVCIGYKKSVRPKLKFYLLTLTQPTLKKFYFQSRIFFIFFLFHCNLRELSNVNSVILANCLSI